MNCQVLQDKMPIIEVLAAGKREVVRLADWDSSLGSQVEGMTDVKKQMVDSLALMGVARADRADLPKHILKASVVTFHSTTRTNFIR